jgi:ribonuclease Z
VFYHFVLLAGPGIPAVTEKEVFDMARKTYSGPLVIGEDLMTFQIEKDQVIQK